jgi:DNA topoisomerase I
MGSSAHIMDSIQAKSNGATANHTKTARELVEHGARGKWWRRRGTKKRGFWYEDHKGRRIIDEVQLERIRLLVIPPAWTHVRIAPAMRSRLQAVGIDTAGRIQYKYHPAFAARQQQKKFAKIERFGQALPALRRVTNEDIALDGFPRQRVLAIIIRLINDLYLRVGSELSVKRYRTYGVTTLRNRHIEIKSDGQLIFSFVGKHHIRHRRIIVDEELAVVMKDLKALGGPKLFEYTDDNGKIKPITPRDVNEYIKAAVGPEFSAKDFRTWGGSLLAAIRLAEIGQADNDRQAKRNIVQAVKQVAEHLGNTPNVCRSCYIHPLVLQRYAEGITLEAFRPKRNRRIRRLQPEYEPEELALLKLFRAGGKADKEAAQSQARAA